MSNNTSLSVDSSIETPLTRTIKLVLFAIPLGPSLLCSIYIMICFIYERNLRRPADHVMIAIIVIDFLELIGDLLAIAMPYLYTGYVHHRSLCLYWVTSNYTWQGIAAWYMAWASIDRYRLIFHHRLRTTFVRHDLSLFIIGVSIVGWYMIITLTHPCPEDWFGGKKFLCGGPCFNTSAITTTADWILIVLVPALLIIIVNSGLLGRVLFKKYRRRPGFGRRQMTWRKTRKLLVQLLGIIVVFLLTQVPLVILSLIQIFFSSDFLIDISHIWLYYMPYLIYIVTPFVYLATTKDCRIRLCRHGPRRIAAVVMLPLLRQGHLHTNGRNVITDEHLNHVSQVGSEPPIGLDTHTRSKQ